MLKSALIAFLSILPTVTLAQEETSPGEDPTETVTREKIPLDIGNGRSFYIVTDVKNGNVCYIIGGGYNSSPLAISCIKK